MCSPERMDAKNLGVAGLEPWGKTLTGTPEPGDGEAPALDTSLSATQRFCFLEANLILPYVHQKS